MLSKVWSVLCLWLGNPFHCPKLWMNWSFLEQFLVYWLDIPMGGGIHDKQLGITPNIQIPYSSNSKSSNPIRALKHFPQPEELGSDLAWTVRKPFGRDYVAKKLQRPLVCFTLFSLVVWNAQGQHGLLSTKPSGIFGGSGVVLNGHLPRLGGLLPLHLHFFGQYI